MALSGVVSRDVASNYKLSIEWTATQNISNNSSTITAKMYWEADSYGYVNSTDTKDGAIIIAGTTYTFSGAGLADLNKGQKKLIATKSKTITHDADGTKDFYIDGYFDAEVSLSGSWYNRIDLVSKTFTLNTIPRKSTLSSSASFTAGSDFTISISRASSSFTHIAYIDVQAADGTWTFIKSINFSTSETSKNSEFDETSKTRIFTAIGGRSSATFRINLNTYSGSTNLGYNTYTGTVSVPAASIGEVTNGLAGADNKVYVDQDIYVGIARNDSEFTHTVAIQLGSYTKTITGVGYGTTWTPSSTEQDSLYSAIGTSANNLKGTVTTTTYYNGVQVRSAVSKDVYFYVRPSTNAPTFSATGLSYEDINAVTLAVTGAKTNIIQNKSSLRVIIPSGSKASPKNGASIVKYNVTINGVTKSANYSASATVNVDYGAVNSATNITASIAAVDSRGLSTTVTLPVTMVPYSDPVINSTPKRRNSFEDTIDIPLSGTISPITIGGSQKNALQAISGTTSALQYRYRENVTGSAWQPWTDLTFTPSGAAYTATAGAVVLDNTKGFIFEIRATDKLSTTTVTRTVASGKPIFFIDSNMKTVSVNKFPTISGGFEVEGPIVASQGISAYNKPYVTEVTATLPATVGWYRIATSVNGINNNNAMFEVFAPLSTCHTFARFEAGVMFGQSAGVSLSQTSYSSFGSLPALTRVRIVYHTTYTGNYAYLEVYNTQSKAVPITVRMVGGTGWSLISPVAGSIPSGYTSKELGFQSGTGIGYNPTDMVYPSPNKGANYNLLGGDYHTLAYHKDAGGFVYLYGLMTGLAIGDTIFTLPVGYKPLARHIFRAICSDYTKSARIDIRTNGDVTVDNTGGSWLSLSGISFYAGNYYGNNL